MYKKISLFMAILLLFNFLISCLYSHSFAAHYDNQGIIPATGGHIKFLDYGSFSGATNNNPDTSFQVEKSGLYTLSVKYGDDFVDYGILNSSSTPLACAGRLDDDNLPSSNSVSDRKVTVYLEAGKEYKVPIYAKPLGTRKNYDIGIEAYDVPLEKSQAKEFEYSSANFTNVNNGQIDYYKTDIGEIDYNSYYKDPDMGAHAAEGTFSTDITPSQGINYDDALAGKQVSALQKAVTLFFIFAICEPLRAIVNATFGPVTIDDILFNTFRDTRLTFYPENGKDDPTLRNRYLINMDANKTVLEVINDYYSYFKGMAILVYIIFLLYIGVRILLKSTARDKDKYKAMLADWVRGVIILFIFPYIIKYMILINESLVSIVSDLKIEGARDVFPSTASKAEIAALMGTQMDVVSDSPDTMTKFRDYAVQTGSLGFAFVYFYLILSIFSFVIIYFKRLITIIFLIVLFPFVAITYALDKVKDGRAQVFNNWFRELVLNIFMQLFHAVSYVVVTTIIVALLPPGGDMSNANIILVMIGVGYIKKSDELLKILFPNMMKGGGAGTVKAASQVAQTAATVSMINQLKKRGNEYKAKYTNARDNVRDTRTTFNEKRRRDNLEERAKLEEKDKNRRMEISNAAMDGIKGLIDPNTNTLFVPPSVNNQNTGNNGNQGNNGGQGGASNGSAQQSSGGAQQPLSQREQQLLDTVDKIAEVYHIPSKEKEFKEKLAKSGLSAEQQQKLIDMVESKVALNRVLSGRYENGVPLSQAKLNMHVRVIHDMINSPEAELSGTAAYMLKQQLMNSNLTIDKKAYYFGNKELTKEEFYKQREKAALIENEKTREDTLKKFNDTKTKKVEMTALDYIEKEIGKGRILDRNAENQVSVAESILGMHAQTGAANLKLGEMTSKEAKRFHRTHEAETQEAIDTFADKSNADSSDRVREAYGIIAMLEEYQRRMGLDASDSQHIDGIDAEELLRLTSRLNKLKSQDEGVERMIKTLVDTGEVEDNGNGQTTPVQVAGKTFKSGKTVKVELKTSLDSLEAQAAKNVLATPREQVDSDMRRTMVNAAESLRRINEQSTDDAALSIVLASEHDDILSAEELSDVIDEYGFVGSQGKTQEEIIYEKFVEEKVNLRIQLSDEAKSRMRSELFSKAVKATGSVIGATLGSATEIATGLAVSGMVAGASSEVSGKNLLLTYTQGTNIGKFVEQVIPGAPGTTDSSLGNMLVDAVSEFTNSRAEERSMDKDSEAKRVMIENANALKRAGVIADKVRRN